MIGCLVLVVSACATLPIAQVGDGKEHAGRMHGYVESSRVTDFCPDQTLRRADERCVVTRGWDYERGVTLVRTFDPSGKLIRTDEPPGADLSLTSIEEARVEALVRSDSRTGAVVNRPDAKLWIGGFVMREPGDPYCDLKSRCIRAITAIDGGNDVILHSVVDLMTDRVVYPFYSPSGSKAASQSGEH
jgi:hypothetical protein